MVPWTLPDPSSSHELTKSNPSKKGDGSITTGAQAVNRTVCYRILMDHEWIVIHTAQGEVEETQVRSFLAAHDIQTTTRGEALRKTHGLTLDGLGQVEILVDPEHADEARRLLDAAERGEFTLND